MKKLSIFKFRGLAPTAINAAPLRGARNLQIFKFSNLQIFMICVCLYSCNLEEEPIVFRESGDYAGKPECETAVRGAYAAAQWIYMKNFFGLTENTVDYSRVSKLSEQVAVDLMLFGWDEQLSSITGFYSDAFAAINRFNSVIGKLERAAFLNASEQQRMIAEVRFMRGLHYFHLVRIFGKMPVTLTETVDSSIKYYPKWENEDIFKKVIIPDLEYAEAHLPFDAWEAHRASGAAASGLLAKVYLWLVSCGRGSGSKPAPYHGWVAEQGLIAAYRDSVIAKCQPVIDNAKYGLYRSFYDVFLIANKVAKEGIIENIFAVNFDFDNNEANPIPSLFFNYYNNAPGWDLTPGREPVCLGMGFGATSYTKEFWEEVHDWDSRYPDDAFGDRRDTTMFVLSTGTTAHKNEFIAAGGGPGSTFILNPPGVNRVNGANCGVVKHRQEKGLETASGGSTQIPVLRYSDVLLMYAEAHLGDAAAMTAGPGYDAFNEVRRRASENPGYQATAVTREKIMQERKVELCFEFDRWFDLVRTFSLKKVMDQTYITVAGMNLSGTTPQPFRLGDYLPAADEEKRMFFPLPLRAIELNEGLVQNELWR
jgi:hypothetical protein